MDFLAECSSIVAWSFPGQLGDYRSDLAAEAGKTAN